MVTFLADCERNPDLFDFRTPVAQAELGALEAHFGVVMPPSFRAILEKVGQGVFFDNESLLGVHELEDGLGEMIGVNDELREKQGLPEHLVVFHLGLGTHAFDIETPGPEFAVVALDEETLEPGRMFSGFEEWYDDYLRKEYASLLSLDE